MATVRYGRISRRISRRRILRDLGPALRAVPAAGQFRIGGTDVRLDNVLLGEDVRDVLRRLLRRFRNDLDTLALGDLIGCLRDDGG